MKDIYKLIEEKRREAEKAQRELDALIIAATLMSGDDKKKVASGSSSVPQRIAAILEAAGKPLHVEEIDRRLKQKFDTNINRGVVSALLYRYAQRVKHFYKVTGKPNTYGLLKWKALPIEEKQQETV